ncbi:HNH endonuclease signature motif containing protein [Pseudarthrobacter sp. L1SW]|uniref:HNH endonuclease signature motif containing protein n=1 Tax=Pseudarthrobacter sp. L1SW TaxID=2851598 RepID=UPI001E64D88F|nr:HNH endonuclease signature motif containing protein [Pseudarthrobacter sp. L1SW]
METSPGTAPAMEGITASIARMNALFLEDAALEVGTGAGAGVDVLQRRYEIRLERMAVAKQLEAQVAAVKAGDAAEAIGIQHAMTPPDAPVHERTYTEMSAIEEIAGVLTLSSPAAGALVTQARQLAALPLAMGALAAGTISWQHAKILADETDTLGPAGAAALVAHFLDPDAPKPARGAAAGELVPHRFRARVRAWRERHHPETLEKRHIKCAADRRMKCTPDRDGMAWLSLYLPADTASAIWNRTTALARGLQGPEETRTLAQMRPDVAAHLLLSAGPALGHAAGTDTGAGTRAGRTGTARASGVEGSTVEGSAAEDTGTPIGLASLSVNDQPDATARTSGTDAAGVTVGDVAAGAGAETGTAFTNLGNVPVPNAQVLVTVPVFSLLGLTDEPADLDGYGPIPASMARKLLADGAHSFHRVLVAPRNGAPLEIGRAGYRLTKAMKKALQLRDGKCTFPGCNNRTLDTEADHLQAWQHGGNTGVSNLALLCPKHHRLKHNSGWKPTPATKTEPPGWTSPTGRLYKAEHHDREPAQWPPGLLPGAPETPGFQGGEPPLEEPVAGNLEDPEVFSPDDPVWVDFYARPPKLPEDPPKEWEWDVLLC